jgi:hypothetical protein
MARRKKAAEPLATIWNADDELWAEVEAVLKELDPPARYGPGRGGSTSARRWTA